MSTRSGRRTATTVRTAAGSSRPSAPAPPWKPFSQTRRPAARPCASSSPSPRAARPTTARFCAVFLPCARKPPWTRTRSTTATTPTACAITAICRSSSRWKRARRAKSRISSSPSTPRCPPRASLSAPFSKRPASCFSRTRVFSAASTCAFSSATTGCAQIKLSTMRRNLPTIWRISS